MIMSRTRLPRRAFLAASAGAAACTRTRSPWQFFTREEGELVEAIAEQIVPADREPGARWAGVANYIDRQLTRHFRAFRGAYREGLAAINHLAKPQRFVDLPFASQTVLLLEIEKSNGPARQVFELLLAHTLQGFYGDPRHGGNRERVSWRMLGIPHPPVRGRSA
jgi:gluconate 2-dehydrogenase gamma chain